MFSPHIQDLWALFCRLAVFSCRPFLPVVVIASSSVGLLRTSGDDGDYDYTGR